MGCCGNNKKNNYEMPYKQIEEYNILKKEIDEIITNNESPHRKDSNKLFELLNKISVKISEFEKELDNLKNKKNIDNNIRDNYIKGFNTDIQEMKEYYLILDNLVKENDNEKDKDNEKDNDNDDENKIERKIENKIKSINLKLDLNKIQKEDFFSEEISLSNRDKKNNNDNNFIVNLKQNLKSKNNGDANANDNMNEQNENDININLNNPDNIYFKKYVRRNKRRNNISPRFFPSTELFGFPKPENFNYLTNNNGLVNKEEISTSENTNDIINIIFVLQNGKKIGVPIKKNDKFLTAIEKLGEKEENLKNIVNMILLDGEEDITDKVKNGENVSSFGFNDYHLIQVKLIEQN